MRILTKRLLDAIFIFIPLFTFSQSAEIAGNTVITRYAQFELKFFEDPSRIPIKIKVIYDSGKTGSEYLIVMLNSEGVDSDSFTLNSKLNYNAFEYALNSSYKKLFKKDRVISPVSTMEIYQMVWQILHPYDPGNEAGILQFTNFIKVLKQNQNAGTTYDRFYEINKFNLGRLLKTRNEIANQGKQFNVLVSKLDEANSLFSKYFDSIFYSKVNTNYSSSSLFSEQKNLLRECSNYNKFYLDALKQDSLILKKIGSESKKVNEYNLLKKSLLPVDSLKRKINLPGNDSILVWYQNYLTNMSIYSNYLVKNSITNPDEFIEKLNGNKTYQTQLTNFNKFKETLNSPLSILGQLNDTFSWYYKIKLSENKKYNFIKGSLDTFYTLFAQYNSETERKLAGINSEYQKAFNVIGKTFILLDVISVYRNDKFTNLNKLIIDSLYKDLDKAINELVITKDSFERNSNELISSNSKILNYLNKDGKTLIIAYLSNSLSDLQKDTSFLQFVSQKKNIDTSKIDSAYISDNKSSISGKLADSIFPIETLWKRSNLNDSIKVKLAILYMQVENIKSLLNAILQDTASVNEYFYLRSELENSLVMIKKGILTDSLSNLKSRLIDYGFSGASNENLGAGSKMPYKSLNSVKVGLIGYDSLKNEEARSMAEMNDHSIFRITKVEIQFEGSFIECIKVWVDYNGIESIFENKYAIGFSSVRNYKQLAGTRLYMRFANPENPEYILVSDVFRNYDNRLANYSRNYCPADTCIKTDPSKLTEVELSKERYIDLFQAKIYTDLRGVNGVNPNGLVQIEAYRKIHINTQRNNGAFIDFNWGYLNYMEIFGGFTKIEKTNRELTLRNSNNISGGVLLTPNYATTLDFLNYQNFFASWSTNLFLFDIPSWKSTFYIDYGIRYGHVPISDSVFTPNGIKLAVNSNKEAHSISYIPKFGLQIFDESRYKLYFSYSPTLLVVHSNNGYKQVASYAKSDINELYTRRSDRWYNCYEASLSVSPTAESENQLFFRLRFYDQWRDRNTSFSQIQIGYRYNWQITK